MTVTGAIRFLVGASLVAAGGSLVAPLATKLAGTAGGATGRGEAVEGAPAMRSPAVGPAAAPPAVVPGPSLPQAALEAAPPVDPWAGMGGDTTFDSAGGLQLDRCPPPPPVPLPPPPHELAQASPAFGDAYRSTLQVPPPRLLDASGPPPAASWAAPLVPAAAPAAAPSLSRARPAREITVPATYCIRDGDDLGTIAGRFYGDTAAAPAIWAANRETVPNPDLLPIGAELRLPPPWAVHGLRRPGAGAIEPVSYARPAVPPADGTVGSAPQAVPWLAPATDLSVPAAGNVLSAHPSPAGATGVRVGPGETLASLARRLYGDPEMAEQIFAANRDRLRSPELLVAGMELRLPRPVTAPWP